MARGSSFIAVENKILRTARPFLASQARRTSVSSQSEWIFKISRVFVRALVKERERERQTKQRRIDNQIERALISRAREDLINLNRYSRYEYRITIRYTPAYFISLSLYKGGKNEVLALMWLSAARSNCCGSQTCPEFD
jgi:hypothetical protein